MVDILLTLAVSTCVVIFFWRLTHAQGRKKWFLFLAVGLSITLSVLHRQPQGTCQRNLAKYLQNHPKQMDNSYVSTQLGVCSQ